MPVRLPAPAWGLVTTFALATMCALAAPVAAQPHRGHVARERLKVDKTDKGTGDKASEKKSGKVQTFDFHGMDLNGKNRTPQLLYFLERANEELERASLKKRSFIPAMVQSVEEDPL